jgi:hypothetical protein
MGLRAQKQAREMAADVIQSLSTSSQCVFWNLSLPRTSEQDCTMASFFKSIIYQALRNSGDIFTQFSEQLNLIKINCSHTDNEWADLMCLLFSKIPKAFVVIETESLHRAHQHDPEWVNRFLQLLQQIIDRTTATGNCPKTLLVVYGKALNVSAETSSTGDPLVTSLLPPAPVPSHLRHIARRSGIKTGSWKLQIPKV